MACLQQSCDGYVALTHSPLPLHLMLNFPMKTLLSDEYPLLTFVGTACIWYGVQAYIGGHCVYLMIRSIWKAWVSDPSLTFK